MKQTDLTTIKNTKRKTKIVCTLGPATDGEGILRSMLESGMNVARFNFSHGDYEGHKMRLDALKALRKELDLPVAAMLDTKGPEVRLKSFTTGSAQLKTGTIFTLHTDLVEGSDTQCSITYPNLPNDVKPGDAILLDDGLVRMTVIDTTDTTIRCKVLNDGIMKNNKGVNIPGIRLSMPYVSEKDREDILFGIAQDFDFIAASFVRTADDVRDLRQILNQHDSNIRIIAKIENREGVNNLDEILSVADGIMVARGDMGVEIDFAEIPGIQKDIIAKCVACGKPVITATQMLESMVEKPRPTRAEITDVANAIYDGTSAIMLSGETASGKYPVEAVQTMHAIAIKTEADMNHAKPLQVLGKEHLSISAAMAHAACTTARDIGADAILTVSQRGMTAQMVSRFRPETTIVALLLDEQVRRQMSLYWGIETAMMPYSCNSDDLVDLAIEVAEQSGFIKNGDLVVVTAGVPVGITGTTNMIRVKQVGGSLVNAIGIGTQTTTGPLCICRTMEEVMLKCKKGDILVVPYTTNEMLPWLRKAAAIITEDTNTEGHTAIVGLTLEKPVIIGAHNAVQRLQDGIQVSVDCTRGTVQTLSE